MTHAPGARWLLPLVIIGLVACAPKEATDDAALLAVADGFARNFNAKDADGMAALYAADAQRLPPGAPPIVGRAAIRAAFADEIAKSWVPITVKTTGSATSGDWGWRSGTWTAELDPPVSGKFVEIWRRTPEGWRIHRDIWNVDAG